MSVSRIIPPITIVFLTVFVWHKILFQSLLGEGFYYFDRQQHFINESGKLAASYLPDLFARFLFDILPPIFGDNLMYYLAFQLLVMILLNLTIFYFVKFFTRNNWIAFVATAIFLGSYIANFEMLGIGQYQRFAQRVPVLIPLFIALMLLVKYLETNKLIRYIFSISLFTISIFFGHFSTFLLPIFLIIPIMYKLLNKNIKKNIVSGLLISLSFFLVNYLLIFQDPLKPTTSFLDFIASRGIGSIIKDIILQFSNMVLPPLLIEKIASISNPYSLSLIALTIPIISFFTFGLKFIKKKEIRLKLIYLSSLIFIPCLLFLNLYLGKVDPSFNISGYQYYFTPSFYLNKLPTSPVKGDRYYLIPYIFISILFSTALWLILEKRSFTYKTAGFLIMLIYLSYNTKLIWTDLDAIQPISKVMKNYIEFSKSISYQFDSNTVIILPRAIIWPAPFIRVFYGDPEMQFYLENDNWQSLVANKKVFIFDYDYQNNKVLKKL